MKKFLYCVCFVSLFCASVFAQQKSVAILDIVIHPDIEKNVNQRDVDRITATIRREAARILPRDQYVIWDDATVQAMGGDVFETCVGANCAVEIARTINADYIVDAKLTRHSRNVFSLDIEIREADIGGLVEAAEPLRSGNIRDFVDQSATVSADMFRRFLGVETPAPSAAIAQPTQTSPFKLPPRVQLSMRWGGAALAVGGIVGGIVYSGMADDEYDKYKIADNTADADARRSDVESLTSTRNLFYILGGVGLSAFTLTLFF